MSLGPLLSSPAPIPSHALLAVLALALGVWQLAGGKGTTWRHRIMGWLWVVLPVYVAVSGLVIHQLRMVGPFSVIHLLAVHALFSLAWGVMLVHRGARAAMSRLFRSPSSATAPSPPFPGASCGWW